MKKLIILDLDNTLIYASENSNLNFNILFRFNNYFTVYERPFATEFVEKCHETGDVIVYTTATRDYADKVCEKLGIRPQALFTREDCMIREGKYTKSVPEYYYDHYDSITIVDDLPWIWDTRSRKNCLIIGITSFTGLQDDQELKNIEL